MAVSLHNPPVLAACIWQDGAADSGGGGDWERESQLLLKLPASLQVCQLQGSYSLYWPMQGMEKNILELHTDTNLHMHRCALQYVW